MSNKYLDIAMEKIIRQEVNKVLDKIKAEIKVMSGDIETISDALEIIDKYKAESDHKCHTCKHYTSGEYDGSCDSYICEHYSGWEREDKG